MKYAVSLRIPVNQYLPEDLAIRAKLFVNVGAFSTHKWKKGERVYLSANCQNAEVVECYSTSRLPNDFDFVI